MRSPMPRWCGRATTIVWVGPERELPAEYRERRAARRGRTAGDPRAGGLPHPSRLRRLASRRVRAADPGPQLPRDRPGGRRHRAHRAADAGRERGGAGRARRRVSRRDARARSHHRRVQERLRARPRRTSCSCCGSTGGWLGEQPVRLVPTFLGAHVVPPEFRDDREGYVDAAHRRPDPEDRAASGSPRFCDVFVEESAFSVDGGAAHPAGRARRRASAPKLHADQLTDGGGAELAAEVGAVSADHLEHASERGSRRWRGRGRGGEPSARLALSRPAADAGPASHRRRRRRRRRHRLQPRLRRRATICRSR